MSFKKFHTANTRGHHWVGEVNITAAPFKVIARPNIYRRQLHFENPVSDAPNHRKRKVGLNIDEGAWPIPPNLRVSGEESWSARTRISRKRKGGTITPWGFRSGDLVEATKAGKTYQGWIGGYSEVNRVVSLYNYDWKRIGQFLVSKTRLLSRRNSLCVA